MHLYKKCIIFVVTHHKLSAMSSIDIRHPLIVCKASAGTGKTFTLAAYYIAMLFSGESYRNILAVTFTKAATTEMKERILT